MHSSAQSSERLHAGVAGIGALAEPALLAHEDYWRAERLEQERRDILSRSWLFAGLAADPAAAITAAARVESCGALLFACDDPAAPSLAAWLGPFAAELRTMSTGLVAVDHRERTDMAANWKLIAENALDDYHPASVHATTLYPSMMRNGERHTRLVQHGAHSLWHNQLSDAEIAFWGKLERRLRFKRFDDDHTNYRHLFLFPNFHMCSFAGAMLVLHRIEPAEAEKSAVDWRLSLAPALAGSAAPVALRRAAVADLAAKARRVLAEDAAVCAAAQLGRHFGVHDGVLGQREVRIAAFQRAVIAARAGKAPAH